VVAYQVGYLSIKEPAVIFGGSLAMLQVLQWL
jgi:hypothetical protein